MNINEWLNSDKTFVCFVVFLILVLVLGFTEHYWFGLVQTWWCEHHNATRICFNNSYGDVDCNCG